MPEKYSITIAFDGPNEMAKWLQGHTFPIHSDANVNRTTGEVNGGASANVSDDSDPWRDFDASPAADVATQATSSGPVSIVLDVPGKGQQKWTFNSGNAPTCGCGNPAAFAEGATNGKAWKRWTCAKGRPDQDNWKSKCDFNEFVGGRGKK